MSDYQEIVKGQCRTVARKFSTRRLCVCARGSHLCGGLDIL